MKERGPQGTRTKLVENLRNRVPHAITIAHEDRYTYGIPDISFTWDGLTQWIEVKNALNGVMHKAREIQLYTAIQLEKNGICWYAIFDELRGGSVRTILCPPRAVKDKTWKEWNVKKVSNVPDYGFIIERLVLFASIKN